MQANQEISDQRANCGRHRVLLGFVIALLIIPVATTLLGTLAFADISPELGNPPGSAEA